MNSITIATPGPWSYDAPVAGRVGIFADVTNPRTGEVTFGVVIGETNRIFDGEGVEQMCANARLICAAPDLLAALREAADLRAALCRGSEGGDPTTWDAPLNRWLAAIARAEGRP